MVTVAIGLAVFVVGVTLLYVVRRRVARRWDRAYADVEPVDQETVEFNWSYYNVVGERDKW